MDILGRNSFCWCGSGRKYKHCHLDFDQKLMDFEMRGYSIPPKSIIKNDEQIDGIRESAKINIKVLDYLSNNIASGMTTEEIDQIVYKVTTESGGIPATLGYEGFPKSVCVSINNVVCHGIPSEDTILHDGDIVNIDVSTIYKKYFSDSSRMFCIGHVNEQATELVEIAKQCVNEGAAEIKPWTPIGNVGSAINEYAKKNGCSVVREIGGHGIGLNFHEEPWVSYVAKRNTGMLMVPGMIFTIEPMINLGGHSVTVDSKDGWTVTTRDGSLSAQWEWMVLVTEDGYELLAY